jgi:hypothetical protein
LRLLVDMNKATQETQKLLGSSSGYLEEVI